MFDWVQNTPLQILNYMHVLFVNFDRHVGFTRVDQTSRIVVNVVILLSLHFNSSGFNNNSGLVGIGCREDGERIFFAIKSERNCNPLENLKQF